ncbi:unnamed protein product, partial [Mesorhabditis spiculigera]
MLRSNGPAGAKKNSRTEHSALDEANERQKLASYYAEYTLDLLEYPTAGRQRALPLAGPRRAPGGHARPQHLQLCQARSARSCACATTQRRFDWNPERADHARRLRLPEPGYGETFADYMARDERTYTPDMLNGVLDEAAGPQHRLGPLPERASPTWPANRHHRKRSRTNDEELTDAPEETLLMDTLMHDPVALPSGQVMDWNVIMRHLLTFEDEPLHEGPAGGERACTSGIAKCFWRRVDQMLSIFSKGLKPSQGPALAAVATNVTSTRFASSE